MRRTPAGVSPRRTWAGWLVIGILLWDPAPLAAQAPVTVEFHQGSVSSSQRVTGMGGAFVAVAEGADGHLINPASYAVRSFRASEDDWFDWDVAVSILNVPADADTQIDVSGQDAGFSKAQILQLGFDLKFGRHGFGAHVIEQAFDFFPEDEPETSYHQRLGGVGYAYALGAGDWVLGLMALSAEAESKVDERNVITIKGPNALFGVLWKPSGERYRLGASFRTPTFSSRVARGSSSLQGMAVPDRLAVPAELSLGGSVLWGRPYNRRLSYGESAEPFSMPPGRSLLVAADLVVTAPTSDSVGVQSFLNGTRQPAGETAVSPRMGAEAVVVPEWVKLRAGTYYEASRFRDRQGRVHGTFGFDARVYGALQVSGVVDAASDYLNAGVGLGFW